MSDFSAFIEGHVAGVMINDLGNAAEIFLRDREKRHFVLRMGGVEKFLVDEMRSQNIIDNVTIWKGADEADDLHSAVSLLVSGSVDETWAQQFATAIRQVEELVRLEERVLLRIEPVYGATVVALARTYLLEPVHVAALRG